MKEWFKGIELSEIENMPNSRQAIAVKAKRSNWLKRKSSGQGGALEYHISNFHEDAQKSLIEMYGTESEKEDIPGTLYHLKCSGQRYKLMLSGAEEELFSYESGDAKPVSNVASINQIETKDDVDIIDIPEFNVQAAAGAGCLTNTEFQTGTFTVSIELVKSLGLAPSYTAIVFCSGESMVPTMNDGDRILVDTRELTEPVKDGVYVIRIDEMVYVKRLKWNILEQSYSIISDNPDYDSFEMKGDDLKRLKIIGRAAMVMRSL